MVKLDETFATVKGGAVFIFLNDVLTSTVSRTDSAGNLIGASRTYEPFGATFKEAVEPMDAFQFTGRENDLTGLYYFRARYYSPSNKRVISEDPVASTNHLYAYADADPISFVDPLGLTKLTVDLKAGKMLVDPEQAGRKPYEIQITSGRGRCQNDPSCKNRENEGPIPPGAYTADVSQLSNPDLLGDIARQLFRGDWGDWRVPLIPQQGTQTFGRSGFFLHGGTRSGSAGCLDIGGGRFGNDVTDRVLQDLLSDPDRVVPVIVR